MPKRKRSNVAETIVEDEKRKAATDITITFTTRKPEWAYLHLELVAQPPNFHTGSLDLLTARTHLTSALSQFLGISGIAIPIDILKLQIEELPPTTSSLKKKTRNMLWIRVPHDDAAAAVSAISSWVGNGGGGGTVAWKIRGRGSWLGALVGGTGRDLFA